MCESACPHQCNLVDYTFPTLCYLKTLQRIFNAENERHSPHFPQNVSDSELIEFARTGFLKIILNYDDFFYSSVDEVPKVSLQSLIGELGNIYGSY